MQNIIKRDEYLNRIIDRKENGLIKVITGIRRCGKSFLLFNLFYDYLIESGVKEEQIITIALDDDTFVKYRDPDELSKYIRGKIVNSDMYYMALFCQAHGYDLLWSVVEEKMETSKRLLKKGLVDKNLFRQELKLRNQLLNEEIGA